MRNKRYAISSVVAVFGLACIAIMAGDVYRVAQLQKLARRLR